MDVRVQVPPSAPSFLKIEYARVVELADSLDSGSSAHYGRAGSSPASRTIDTTLFFDFWRSKGSVIFLRFLTSFSNKNSPLLCLR